MKRYFLGFVCLIGLGTTVHAQEEGWYTGASSIGSSEPLFSYDDQEPWKHGYIQAMPFYGGWTYFRPYNYHHVFSQVPTAAGWGMSAGMPYSQQFWHKYEKFTDLSRGDRSPLKPYEAPVEEYNHYPQPIRSGASFTPDLPTPPQQWTPVSPGVNQTSWQGQISQPRAFAAPNSPQPLYAP
ncbi:MAG: hypothetical protein KDA80_13755 [Planctomycetaceae bacterium]|nr:hypothetical protein [Planctomycetaceae bacterium]